MKIKSFLTAVVLIAGIASVQAQDKRMWVGGSLGMWMSKVNDNDAKMSFKIEPEFGFSFNKNMAIWGSIGFMHSENTRIDAIGGLTSGGKEANGITFSSFFRYSFLHGDFGFLFLDGGLSYTNLNMTSSNTDYDFFKMGITPGVAINVTKHLALTGKFGFFGYQHYSSGSSYDEDEFGLDLNFKNFYLGFIFRF